MCDALEICNALLAHGAGLFTGVPDSLLSKFSACLMKKRVRHIIAANEGNAIGLAIGDYLATLMPSVVYMQNSGLGNAVNPITSLADPDVYAIPLFMVIGWRGEPGYHDEPQHVKQGRITLQQLDVLEIPYKILTRNDDPEEIVSSLWKKMIERSGPVAMVVEKAAIDGNWPVTIHELKSELKREQTIEQIVNLMPTNTFFVATTGKAGRELFEIRKRRGEEERDFLTVGGMGHASSIALAIALHQSQRWTVCFDGDGASIMHMGAMATIANLSPRKFIHVILNNCAHESVGGQPTISDGIDYNKLSDAFGYSEYAKASSLKELETAIKKLNSTEGCKLLEVRLLQGSRKDLGRPTSTPVQNKENVIDFLKNE